MQAVKIDVSLEGRNRSRLESKIYNKSFTDVPNRVLPETLRADLNQIYESLTGEPLPEVGYTFTVRADDSGALKSIYAPGVYSTEEGGLIIRWGEVDIPLITEGGSISVGVKSPGKIKFSFKEEQIGKYPKTCLSVSVSKDKTLVSMPFPVRQIDLDSQVGSEVLDALLENAPEELSNHIAVAGDISKRGEGGPRMVGNFVKPSDLPLGSYKVTTYRKKDTTWGMKYYVQAVVEEPFVASVRKKDEDGEWVTVEEEIRDFVIVKANNKLKMALSADPVITAESPAVLSVLEHGEFNGHKTAKVKLVCESFTEDPDSFAMDF